ncbi:hypothetical protein [Thalassospira profundimaris]|uniref:hypothetical protein n=1 Tax=Thalassospira profundimaris TaxID=502049 RepID=UPI0002871AE8|nr:hypothetical protein [Thalassospira profundimaris]EKF08346.1 hypothetical protein TH2_09514 [Thalassospira profundimaris WP0211]
MALSDVALCARALVMIGAAPISSFEEDVAEAEIARMLYASVRDGMLAGYPWRFAGRGCWLSRLADGDGAGAGSAKEDSNLFALPRDFIRLLSLENEGGKIARFELRDQAVLVASDSAHLSYVARLPEGSFPAWFDMALMARLAAEFCLPLTESSTRAEYLFKRAEDQLREARLADAQQSTPHAIDDFSLISARN